MFQNKNNQTDDSSQTTLSQERDLPIKDLSVHTMKKDLEAINNPEPASAEHEHPESASRSQSMDHEKLTEAWKSSPFSDFQPKKSASENTNFRTENTNFRTETTKSAISDSRIEMIKSSPSSEKTFLATKKHVPNPENTSLAPEENAPQPEKHLHHIDFSKVFAGVIAVLVIAIIAAGGYYFWTTRQSAEVVVTPPVTEPEPISKPQPELVAKFSIDQPNTLTIDTPTGATLKESLQNYAKDIVDEKITSPVEFVFVDIDKKPVLFKDFAKILGITFSPALTVNLSDTFSLFIYNDNTAIRLGLAIDSNDPIELKNLMALEEKTLAKSVSPIFLFSDYTLIDKAFASSEYNGLAIRYMNIISPEDLSVDYTIYNNKLAIGTTKMTLQSIIDYLKPRTE